VLGSLCRAKISGLVELTETKGATAGRVHGIHVARGQVISVESQTELDALFRLEDAKVAFHVACAAPPEAGPKLTSGEVLRGRPRVRDRSASRASASSPIDQCYSERRDALRVLGLGEDAEAAEVARAFRALAVRLHPDRHTGATEAERRDLHRRFAAISAAYHRLAS
jgi:hypothetical protein